MNFKLIRMIIFCLFGLSVSLVQARGTESGGGGGVIARNSGWLLIDFSISSALKNSIKWSFTEDELQAPIFWPAGVDPLSKTRIAAYYLADAPNFTVQVNQSLWNQLGLYSRVGLVIHEGLRHLQIGQAKHFDEKSLQLSTSLLVLCEPNSRLNYYIQYLILNGPDLAEKLYGDFGTVTHENCVRTF
jgi:hypothetical protein